MNMSRNLSRDILPLKLDSDDCIFEKSWKHRSNNISMNHVKSIYNMYLRFDYHYYERKCDYGSIKKNDIVLIYEYFAKVKHRVEGQNPRQRADSARRRALKNQKRWRRKRHARTLPFPHKRFSCTVGRHNFRCTRTRTWARACNAPCAPLSIFPRDNRETAGESSSRARERIARTCGGLCTW